MIPVYWLSMAGGCVRCRWDERWVEDLLLGRVKRVAGHPDVKMIEGEVEPGGFGVVVYPMGEDRPRDAIAFVNEQIARLKRVVLIVTSDEASRFPVGQLEHPDMKLWVMQPRPEITYPEGTRFISAGPARANSFVDVPKTLDWVFRGQDHRKRKRRRKALNAMWAIGGNGRVVTTPGFLQGVPRGDYLRELASAKIAICPTGATTQDSFRTWEALSQGCVPIVDAYRDSFGGGDGFWEMLCPPGVPFPVVRNWNLLPQLVAKVLAEWPELVTAVHSWWHVERWRLASAVVADLRGLDWRFKNIEVIVTTSPTTKSPDTQLKMLGDTLASIRARLPDAHIWVCCDGVRPEQKHLTDTYREFVRTLLLAAEHMNVTPFVFDEFTHQAAMALRVMPLVSASHVLFAEHDTPLIGEIPFDDLLDQMESNRIDSVRFHYAPSIHPEHDHMMLGRVAGTELLRTYQWSQRPHLANTQWYLRVLSEHFTPESRTMIEDVMHGVVDYAANIPDGKMLDRYRLAIYAPWTEGGIQRSDHLDGRGAEPKFPFLFDYPDGKVPPGAPHPRVGGWPGLD